MPNKRTSIDARSQAIDDNGQDRLVGSMRQALRTTSSATKKAKSFEVQKMVKRLRQLRGSDNEHQLSDQTETERELTDQLDAIKRVEHRLLAALGLFRKLVKTRLLLRHGQGLIGSTTHATRQSAWNRALAEADLSAGELASFEDSAGQTSSQQRAFARLTSNRMVADTVSQQVDKIASASGLVRDSTEAYRHRSSSPGLSGDKGEQRAATTLPSSAAEESSRMEAGGKESTVEPRSAKRRRVEREGKGPRESRMKLDDKSDGKERVRHNEGSGEESDESSSSERSDRLPELATGFVAGRGLRLNRTASVRGSDDDDDNRTDREWSDGDEDLDMIDEDAADRTITAPRKNRMGQRARRALYEKKYGKDANHIRLRQSGHGEDRPRTSRRQNKGERQERLGSMKVGPILTPSDRPGRLKATGTAERKPTASISTRPAIQTQDHPSWLAKQHLKQKQEEAMQSSQQSRKIVFD